VNEGLRKRISTAIVLGVIFLSIVLLLPPVATLVLLTLLVLAGAWEWSAFLRLRSISLRSLYVALVAVTMALAFKPAGCTPAPEGTEAASLQVQ